jgi:hypothetical protein
MLNVSNNDFFFPFKGIMLWRHDIMTIIQNRRYPKKPNQTDKQTNKQKTTTTTKDKKRKCTKFK